MKTRKNKTTRPDVKLIFGVWEKEKARRAEYMLNKNARRALNAKNLLKAHKSAKVSKRYCEKLTQITKLPL